MPELFQTKSALSTISLSAKDQQLQSRTHYTSGAEKCG